MIEELDPGLKAAWLAMRSFSSLVNLGTQTQRRISAKIILDTMTSVMYRLLDMEYPTGSIEEAVRLGLLAFSYHVFLQWRDIKLPNDHLTDALKNSIHLLRQTGLAYHQFMLWMLMVAAISVFGVDEESWLKEILVEYVTRFRAKTWKDLESILKQYLWIPLLDDRQGQYIYKTLTLEKVAD